MKAFCYCFQHITRARETDRKVGPWWGEIMEKNYLCCVLNKSFEVLEREKMITENGFLAAETPRIK